MYMHRYMYTYILHRSPFDLPTMSFSKAFLVSLTLCCAKPEVPARQCPDRSGHCHTACRRAASAWAGVASASWHHKTHASCNGYILCMCIQRQRQRERERERERGREGADTNHQHFYFKVYLRYMIKGRWDQNTEVARGRAPDKLLASS